MAKTTQTKTPMKNEFPKGWDEARVQLTLTSYESQSEDDAVAEDEAGVLPSESVIRVPRDLVAQVRELIVRHHG